MSNGTPVKERALVEYETRAGLKRKLTFDLVRKYMVTGQASYVTDQEIMYFMAECQARRLDPLRRECYLVKFSQNEAAAIITAKDFFLSRAESHKELEGWKAGIIVTRTCPSCDGTGRMEKLIVCGKCGGEKFIELKREGACPRDGDVLIGGWFEGQKRGRKIPTVVEVDLRGYIRYTKQGDITRFWNENNQPMMIRKVALSQGLREMFPDQYAGLYDQAEVPIETDTPESPIIEGEGQVVEVRDTKSELEQAVASQYPPRPPSPVAAGQWLPLFDQAYLEQKAAIASFDQRIAKLTPVEQEWATTLLFDYMKIFSVDALDKAKARLIEEKEIDNFIAHIKAGTSPIETDESHAPAGLGLVAPGPDEDEVKNLEALILNAKQKTLQNILASHGEKIKASQYGEKIKTDFALKWQKLFGDSIYNEGQPWFKA